MPCLLQEIASRWCHQTVCLVLTIEVYGDTTFKEIKSINLRPLNCRKQHRRLQSRSRTLTCPRSTRSSRPSGRSFQTSSCSSSCASLYLQSTTMSSIACPVYTHTLAFCCSEDWSGANSSRVWHIPTS